MLRNKKTGNENYILFSILLIAVPLFFISGNALSGCSDNAQNQTDSARQNATPISRQDKPLAVSEPTQKSDRKPDEQTTSRAPKILTKKGNPDEGKTPPEIGYGARTESEIMAEEPREAHIAVIGPMTGELRLFGIDTSNGAELASDELNIKGGIKGHEFDLLVYDTGGTISGTQAGIEKLLEYKTLAIVGAATGEVSFSANKMLNENQLIMVSAGSRRRLGDTGPYNFRTTLTDKSAIKALVKYIVKARKWNKFALFSSVVNDYSIQLTAVFKAELINQGLNVTHELFLWSSAMSNMKEEDTSVSGQLIKIKDDLPDAIVFTGSAKEAVELVDAMVRMGINIPIVGGEDLMSPEFINLGARAKGALVYSGFNINSTNPKVVAFVGAYTSRFKSKPSGLAALSYDTYNLLSVAIERAKSMRPSHVQKSLLSIKDFVGVTGKMYFDESGEPIKMPYLFEFRKSGDQYLFTSVQEPF